MLDNLDDYEMRFVEERSEDGKHVFVYDLLLKEDLVEDDELDDDDFFAEQEDKSLRRTALELACGWAHDINALDDKDHTVPYADVDAIAEAAIFFYEFLSVT